MMQPSASPAPLTCLPPAWAAQGQCFNLVMKVFSHFAPDLHKIYPVLSVNIKNLKNSSLLHTELNKNVSSLELALFKKS